MLNPLSFLDFLVIFEDIILKCEKMRKPGQYVYICVSNHLNFPDFFALFIC